MIFGPSVFDIMVNFRDVLLAAGCLLLASCCLLLAACCLLLAEEKTKQVLLVWKRQEEVLSSLTGLRREVCPTPHNPRPLLARCRMKEFERLVGSPKHYHVAELNQNMCIKRQDYLEKA